MWEWPGGWRLVEVGGGGMEWGSVVLRRVETGGEGGRGYANYRVVGGLGKEVAKGVGSAGCCRIAALKGVNTHLVGKVGRMGLKGAGMKDYFLG